MPQSSREPSQFLPQLLAFLVGAIGLSFIVGWFAHNTPTGQNTQTKGSNAMNTNTNAEITPRQKRQQFYQHLYTYLVIISMLFAINMMTSRQAIWFIWPLLGWGTFVALHYIQLRFGGEADEAEETDVFDDDNAKDAERRTRLSSHTARQVASVRTYQQQIKATLAQTDGAGQLDHITQQVDQWVDDIDRLSQQVDALQQNPVLARDLEHVPQTIASLKERLATEEDAYLKEDLQQLLTNREQQWAALQDLQLMVRRAELQVERTVSSLGTLYSQLLTGQSTHQVADYRRLSAAAEEEARRVQDYLDALQEVKLEQRG